MSKGEPPRSFSDHVVCREGETGGYTSGIILKETHRSSAEGILPVALGGGGDDHRYAKKPCLKLPQPGSFNQALLLNPLYNWLIH